MTPKPPISPLPSPSLAPYVWSVVVLVLIGAILVLGIIAIHPQSDPIDVMGQVAKGLAPTIVGVFAFLKSQEVKAVSESTHVAVNSRLDAWMEANTQISKAVGVVQGIAEEKARALESEPPAPK